MRVVHLYWLDTITRFHNIECPVRSRDAIVLLLSWTEILYIFIVLFLISYGTYFIMRRALAFGARVRGLDDCAAQRFRGAIGDSKWNTHMFSWR